MRFPRYAYPLHWKIGLLVFGICLGSGAVLVLLQRASHERLAQEWMQSLNRDLAGHILRHQPEPLISERGIAAQPLLRSLSMYVTTVNPALEVYLLDPEGSVLGHALDGAQVVKPSVDLAPIAEFLDKSKTARFPLLGDDPRNPGQANIFSAVAIHGPGGDLRGYLYAILHGQAGRGLAQGLDLRSGWHASAVLGVMAIVFSGIVMFASIVVLTRPLRQLNARISEFRVDGEPIALRQRSADELSFLADGFSEMTDRIQRQFEQLEHSGALRRELVSNLSHDLQTPLTNLQGYLERCLRTDVLDSKQQLITNLAIALRQCGQLERRIKDLFELSKLDSGALIPTLEDFCLAELLHDVVQGYQLAASRAGISLGITCSSQSAAPVRADIALVERVLQNLIDNALKFAATGGFVRVDLQVQQDHVSVSVTDNGEGIAPEHLANIFERYWSAQQAHSTLPGPSAGLGLAIVKRILDLHASSIRVSSGSGQGTCFQFDLPRALRGSA